MNDDLSEVSTFFKIQANNIINSGNVNTAWALWDVLSDSASRFQFLQIV